MGSSPVSAVTIPSRHKKSYQSGGWDGTGRAAVKLLMAAGDCAACSRRGVRRCKFKWLPSAYEKELLDVEEARKKQEKLEAEAIHFLFSNPPLSR